MHVSRVLERTNCNDHTDIHKRINAENNQDKTTLRLAHIADSDFNRFKAQQKSNHLPDSADLFVLIQTYSLIAIYQSTSQPKCSVWQIYFVRPTYLPKNR